MKTILATTYAVNPYKGSEDAMGWNYVTQIARYNKVIAVTRENNQADIERYMLEHPSEVYTNIEFLYFDLPYRYRFWKKGGRGALLYFYLWQRFMPSFVKQSGVTFDIAHNLNFHNDWTPTFLWQLEQPLVWGPVGHHAAVPKNFIRDSYGLKAYVVDQARWLVKQLFWNFSPALRKSAKRSDKVICMNSSIPKVLPLREDQMITVNSVCSEFHNEKKIASDKFTALFVGRFVALKGPDVAIRAFGQFYHTLSEEEKSKVEFVLVGKGPAEHSLRALIKELKLEKAVRIILWIERSELNIYYRKASVFLFPSHEGAGMVVPEAMSYGLPVLAFDNIGPGEFISEQCGVKIPYGKYTDSVTDFANSLHRMYTDKDYLDQLSVGARKQYEEKFSWDKRGELLDRIYQDI